MLEEKSNHMFSNSDLAFILMFLTIILRCESFYKFSQLKVCKSLLTWCLIYCSLNDLNNKANTRKAGEGEQTLRFAIYVLQIN